MKRFTIDLEKGTTHSQQLSPLAIEYPHIHYAQYLTIKHSYVYGLHAPTQNDLANSLIKIDVDNNKHIIWHEDGCYPGRPTFVPRHKQDAKTIDGSQECQEDDGVVLSTVFDSKNNTTFLLILDAGDFKELGRAMVPHALPFARYSRFYGVD